MQSLIRVCEHILMKLIVWMSRITYRKEKRICNSRPVFLCDSYQLIL